MLKLLLLLGAIRLALSFCADVPTAQPRFDYAASESRLRHVLQRNGLDPLAMPQTPCQRKVDGFEGVLEPFCLQYTRGSEVNAGLWSECTLTVPTDYCLLVQVCLGCPSDGNCTAEQNSFVVLTPLDGTDESGGIGDWLGRTADPGGRWGDLGGRVAVELCTQRCSSALFAMPSNRLHVAFVPESVPPARSFRALHSYVKVRYLAVPSARAGSDAAAASDKYVQEWLEAGCDNGASGRFPPILSRGDHAVIGERSATGPVPARAERIVHLGGGYPVFRLVAGDDADGRHLLGELVHSYLQHWLPSPLRLRLRTRSLRLRYSRRRGHRPPTLDGRVGREATPRPRRQCAPQHAVPQMAVRLEGCQFELQGKSGRFYSPNFPDSYPELVWCSWSLQAKETQSIVVKICGFAGGDECCLHSDRLIFEETPRRSIVAMVLSCWGHNTYYYTPKGTGLSVLLVSGHRQASKFATPRRFWGEYFVLDEWDTLDLSRLDCGDPGGNSILMNVLQQSASVGDGDKMVLPNSEIADLIDQVPLDIKSLTNEWDSEVNEHDGTEAGIQPDILYEDVRQSSFDLANEGRGKMDLKIGFDKSSVPLGSKVENFTSSKLAEKKAIYDVELLKRMTTLPVLKTRAHLSTSVTVRDRSVNFHQTHNHVKLHSPKTSAVNLRATKAVNETPIAAEKTHNTPGFLKPTLQNQLLSPLNVIQQTLSSLTKITPFKNKHASVFQINLISATSITMLTNSVKADRFKNYFPNAFSDSVIEDYVTSSTKNDLGPAFEIEPSYLQSKVMSQHFVQLSKATTLALPGSSTQTFPKGGYRVSVNQYSSSHTLVRSKSGGKAQVFENMLQSSTHTQLLVKISELVKGTKRLASGKKVMKASTSVASWLKSHPLATCPVQASLVELSHSLKNTAILKTIDVTRKHKGRQASRTRWHSLSRNGTHNVLTKPATAQYHIAASTKSIINFTPVTTSSIAERTILEASVDSNSWSILPEVASLSQSVHIAQVLPSNKSDVSSPTPVFGDLMTEDAKVKLAAGVESVRISPSTVTAHGTSSSDGPFPTLKTKVKSQSLDIGTGPFKPREYTWFKMSVDSIVQKKAREGIAFGHIVRLLSFHLSQLMEKNVSYYSGSNFLTVVPRQAGWAAQGLQVQTEFHAFFLPLSRANARLLQRTLSGLALSNLVNRHLESPEGALRLQILSISVTDLNECDVGEDLCDANALCHNTVGSYVCFCRENYINLDPVWKGTKCQSILAKEAPEVGSPVSPLVVALVPVICVFVLLLVVGLVVSSIMIRRKRLQGNGIDCARTPAIYFHQPWEEWHPPSPPTTALTRSDMTLLSRSRAGPPRVSVSRTTSTH